ncbi:MAG: two-component system, OmpR family, sensor histidine kinase MtrB [Kribbellaceae bacterium]|nr:two-component system, OmpR family, sensor histidine kinase MtrB [Kribbellaceae bacterium]
MLAYGLLALGLSVVLAMVTWTVVSGSLIDQRISSAIVQTSDNAAVLEIGLADPQPAVVKLLGGLPSTDSAASMVIFGGKWFSSSAVGGPDQLPPDFVATVRAGSQAHRRLEVAGQQVLAVGMPLTKPGDALVELHSLAGLDGTLRTLSITLALAALVTAALGLAVGRLASTLALRPLAELTQVGAAVARGQLNARLDAENDPDLGGLARSFNQTAATLEKRVAADARFAGDISHELRTPLTTMLNSMQVIQHRRSEVPPAVREPLDLLADDLERFRRLVLDLLEISRHDGGDEGSREIVRISDLVRAAADATAGRPVTVVEPDAAGLTLQADKRRLERVIANLVDNAEDHGGGCKDVTVSSGGLGVIVYVDDAGPGVPPDNRDRIFERFGRGATELDRQGIGLGLAIVASHVQWHGGTIRVEDRPGGGARFIVELPAKPA